MNGETAVIICAGPSLDALPRRAWDRVANAGAIVAVNGAIAAEACAGVRFTYVSAMDARQLAATVPRFDTLWSSTPAWRLSMIGAEETPAETYVREVDERDGVEGWSDDPDAGYAGGSSAMVTVNWLCNQRGFRRVAFLGLDMIPGEGGHARGAGNHTSGFAMSAERHAGVSRGWEKVCRQAALRGIEIVNLTPGTGLRTMPRAELPR
ncbi:MAG: hypothetical protein AABO58_05900 [Acidobacteriota bacterium]